jgi:hypothetical protein
VFIFGSNNTVGGTVAGAGNLISANGSDGIDIGHPATGNEVQGNLIGTDASGTIALGNGGDGVNIMFASNNTIGGTASGARNVISGNLANGIRNLGSGQVIQGNYIGTDITGTQALGNGSNGVLIFGPNNTIGGTVSGAGNLISGNAENGISGGAGDLVQGNRIGTDITGTQALGNGMWGVSITNSNNTIGGTAAGAGNLISGNGSGGIVMGTITAHGNEVQGNLIGTDISGTAALGNDGAGIALGIGSTNNTIGGTTAAAANVISANSGSGVLILGVVNLITTSNLVEGNFIGTDASGTITLGNAGDGVTITFGSNNTIGGTVPGAGNLISGNAGNGISVAGTGNLVEGNQIGTDITGTRALGNGGSGVSITDSNNTIGGVAAGARNLISGNGTGVIVADSAFGTLIEGNYIGTDASGANPLGNSVGIELGSLDAQSDTGVGTTVVGNVISGNSDTGLESILENVANVIQGNLIGTDATGTRAVANGIGLSTFLDSNDTIGGTTAGAGNTISGNMGSGIFINNIFGGLVIEGNRIGTDVTGTRAVGNQTGVLIEGQLSPFFGFENLVIGGTAAGAGNVISGNTSFGVEIETSGVALEGNLIGTDVTGTRAVGNSIGIDDVLGRGNTIGGTAAGAGNVISGNLGNGVELIQGANGELVQGNRIGTDVTGTVALGNGGDGILIATSGNIIGGTAAGAGNVVSANQANGIEISIGGGNLVQGNLIGTNTSGTAALGNLVGVTVDSQASNNTIGGTAPVARNVISGNRADGILSAGTGEVIEGNYIGTDITGTQGLGNNGDGISASSNTTIGVAGGGNVISANGGNGISLPGTANLVQGNQIGTDITGTHALGNGGSGVFITGSNNTVGDTAVGAGNLISANGGDGIEIIADGTQVQGNLIGTNGSGTAALGNGGDGIAILNGSANTIGGTTTAAANVISANGGSGVFIAGVSATSNLIAGNFIGTDVSATISLGNRGDGVTIQNASNNTIAGTVTGAGNVIAFNHHDGVLVDTGTGNAILSDLIFSSGNLGIELLNNGNNDLSAPRLLAASQTDSGTMVVGMVFHGTPNSTFTVQLFSDPSADASGHGEGQQLLGTFTVTTNPAGIATFEITVPTVVPVGQIITATATDANNNTSEFSDPVVVEGQ